MQKKLLLVLSLIVHWCDSVPAGLGSLKYDKLDTDLSDLKYEVEEEDLDDYSKLMDESANISSNTNDDSKIKVKNSGFKKKNTESAGVQAKHNVGDLKKFFKSAGVHDQGTYNDDDIYGIAKGIIGAVLGTNGNETRKYRKGSKSRGFHRVQHKDEYEKDKLFYEDDETKGEVKKVGGKVLGFKIGAGAGFNKGHFLHDHQKGIYGKQGYLDEGFLDKQFKDFTDSQGFDGSFSNKR
ncbi:hypothetical protein K1T71_012073 [Dendrolimus kikuchii]|uniref:Uncharacterized protein n=1 Tax=Dendrolimus kikuchii TaxID=765133 RepID=A0ACC1CKH1_9NEOP|nr:hypothetical protein K1T71_012073 [Dendrolimus kikuchii]